MPGFDGATFKGRARFVDANFADARFNAAIFEDATFGGVIFDGEAEFGGVTFKNAWFDGATFKGLGQFGRVRFTGAARFDDAAPRGATTSAGDARFVGATFSGEASFSGAKFTAGFQASFHGADFGSKSVKFENPKQWGPPAPTFDWDGDLSAKPQNVTPQDWPPTG